MRVRYIKPGQNKRLRILTNNVDALSKLDKSLDTQGFKQVGLLAFIRHFITAGRAKRVKRDSTRA